jgi:hypothetical protein
MTKVDTFFLGIHLAIVGWYVGFDWRIGFAVACLVLVNALVIPVVERALGIHQSKHPELEKG